MTLKRLLCALLCALMIASVPALAEEPAAETAPVEEAAPAEETAPTEEAATEEAITVPDVMGMTASEANDAIVGLGLNIAMTGDAIDDAYCVVTNQLPVAGEQVPVGSTVTVALTQQDPPEEAG